MNPPDQVDENLKWYAALHVNLVKTRRESRESASPRIPASPPETTRFGQVLGSYGGETSTTLGYSP